MHNVERELFLSVYFVFFCVANRCFWADKNFSEMLFVDWKGDAVGGRWIIKKLIVELGDFLRGYKINRNF